MKDIIEYLGVHQCPSEPAQFVFYDDPATLIVVTSADNFICTYSHEDIVSPFKTYVDIFVTVTTQESNSLKYPNIEITQTDQGTSIDQTHHIQKFNHQ